MTDYNGLIVLFEKEIRESLNYLKYSKEKTKLLPTDLAELDAETLESWESFCARFARVTDIFLAKYIRSSVLRMDPAFRGELRDYVDKAEKMDLVSSADMWMEIRELRNKISHEYSRSDLKQTFEDVRGHCVFVIEELDKVFP